MLITKSNVDTVVYACKVYFISECKNNEKVMIEVLNLHYLLLKIECDSDAVGVGVDAPIALLPGNL